MACQAVVNQTNVLLLGQGYDRTHGLQSSHVVPGPLTPVDP